MVDSIDKIVSLAKRRGFIYPGSEIYGGLANSWDYGPLGTELKNNIKNLWWKKFVQSRDDMLGLDAALIMNSKVWEASGHLKEFSDPLIECKTCKHRFRADQIEEMLKDVTQFDFYKNHKQDLQDFLSLKKCAKCGGELSRPRQFNLMLKTFLGPAEEKTNEVYFRPETAQGMFVDFKNVLDTSRKRLPFGIAQIGKAFRNEITPGNFIFRTREFEQMEIEYFFAPPESDANWQELFEYWRKQMLGWIKEVGIDEDHIYELEVPDDERAHYSKKTIDFEYDFPFGRKELYGLAYRTDFDLKNHFKEAPYKDNQTGEAFWPHVIEPTWGVDRTVLAVLCESYEEEKDRVVLKISPKLAPYKAAIFPLLANKPELVNLARKIYDDLRSEFSIAWDERGNIGKRYYSQDEIGTPSCITVDFESLEKDDVTIRDRNTMEQKRINIRSIRDHLKKE